MKFLIFFSVSNEMRKMKTATMGVQETVGNSKDLERCGVHGQTGIREYQGLSRWVCRLWARPREKVKEREEKKSIAMANCVVVHKEAGSVRY